MQKAVATVTIATAFAIRSPSRLREGLGVGKCEAGLLAHPAPPASGRGDTQASSSASSFSTGPLSWPLASTSRSTSSMIAIGAASLARMPALTIRQ